MQRVGLSGRVSESHLAYIFDNGSIIGVCQSVQKVGLSNKVLESLLVYIFDIGFIIGVCQSVLKVGLSNKSIRISIGLYIR